ncbi:ABC transporter permease subunit [Paenibacillus sp. L3-i20]|uniref:ABC transporter permease subunit n=1 Tax=Paenibacillus sp. L3-i20 TaxID=2905833 RepID=UPI001EE0A498|nr:ABC transporter permease subunit [Paenibacillus sp. L3-i20]GKU78878.1 hypothetical protein L3i20_v232750 [Paenibacillus sp. L3-i20]
MLKVAQKTSMILGIFLFVFLFALMPVVVQFDPDGTKIQISLEEGFHYLKYYISGIETGESFKFDMGSNERSFWEEIGKYFITSFYYVALSAVVGSAIGIFVGIYFAVSKARVAKSIVDFVGSLPDFVIVMLLQFGVVLFLKSTGILLFEVATLTSDEPSVMLPLIAMIIIPANYLIRSVAMQMKLTLTEDYIGTAKARGLSKTYIIFYHALPNVLPYIKGDLHKLMGIIMGNLFIVEYLFNNKGISMLIFANAFVYEAYQFDIVVNGLLAFLVLYGIGYFILRAFIYLLGKVFLR